MLPSGLKPNDVVYFIPYTTGEPQVRRGTITDDWKGELYITYCTETENNLADNGEWYICKEDEYSDLEKLNEFLKYVRAYEDAMKEIIKNWRI